MKKVLQRLFEIRLRYFNLYFPYVRLLVTQLGELRSFRLQSSFSIDISIRPMVWIAKHFTDASSVGPDLTDYPAR